MAFTTTVLTEIPNIGSGEVSGSGPVNQTAYDNFEDGLVMGRFAQSLAGVISNLDGTATPIIVGVVARQLTGEIGVSTYRLTGTQIPDEHANVLDLGPVTVDVTAAAVPTFGAPVYTVNAAGADSGKATQDSTGTLLIPNATFFREIKTGVWEIKIKSYMV